MLLCFYMQIVILAAGRGSRMKNLTQNTPKPLLIYQGVTLLEHKFNNLPSMCTEIIIVVGYLSELIRTVIGQTYNTIPITYVIQDEIKGTANALWQCKDILKEKFMVLMGDDLYDHEDLQILSSLPDSQWAILTYVDKPSTKAGKIVTDNEGNLKEILEDFSGTSPYYLLYTGACVLTPEIFTKGMVKLKNGEYGLPQTFTQFVNLKNIRVFETKKWIRITAPEDLK